MMTNKIMDEEDEVGNKYLKGDIPESRLCDI